MPKRDMTDLLKKPEPSRDEKIGSNGQKMNVADRMSLEQQIRDTEENTGQLRSVGPSREMKDQLEHRKDILRHDDDLRAKAYAGRDQLNSRKKQLESVLKENMPTHNEMWSKSGTTESQRAIRHNMEFQSKFAKEIREYQQVMVSLEPDDPQAQSLERIRPD